LRFSDKNNYFYDFIQRLSNLRSQLTQMKKITFSLLFLLLSSAALVAQDAHFSQFFASPLTLNPALTGKFDGVLRFSGNYRNQWPSINNAFITTTGSVDFHVGQNLIPHNDNWGLGLVLLNDNSAAGAVNYTYYSLSTAYHKGLDEEGFHQLSGGIQITYANTFINTSNLKFEDQLTPSGFTGSSSSDPLVAGLGSLSSNYIDMNAGILYSGSTTDRNNFYAGASLYHINKPTQRLTTADSYVINPRSTFHAGTYFGISDNVTMHFSAIQTFQGGASETVLGGAFQLIANPEEPRQQTSLYVGSWLRLNDAIIPYLGLEFNDARIGVTYDYTTSALKTASENQGGLELSLMYIYRPSTDKPINCPKF